VVDLPAELAKIMDETAKTRIPAASSDLSRAGLQKSLESLLKK
jgi:hypothetical protein